MNATERPPKGGTRSPSAGYASEIAPGIYVGGFRDASGFAGRRICVRDEGDEVPAGTTHVPVYDGEADRPLRANLDRVAELVEEARAAGEPVLLFCGHGVRRGPLAGAWYLHRHEGIPLEAAFDRIREARPQIQRLREWAGGWESLDEPSPSRRRA